MDITKKKQTHRYREQTSGYYWGEGQGTGREKYVMNTRVPNPRSTAC